MRPRIQLLSTDFDGTLVSHLGEPALDRPCMESIRELQDAGAIWAINTGRSVDLLESGLADFSFAIRPDFILTEERDVFRPAQNGDKWEAFGDWNERCAREHRELFSSASAVLGEVIDFVTQKTQARVIYEPDGPAGLIANSEEEMNLVTEFRLPTEHSLSAFLPCRLSQRGGARRAGAFDRSPARKHLHGGRSSQ